MASDGKEPKPGAYTWTSQLESPVRSVDPSKRTLTEALVPPVVTKGALASAVQMRSGDATHEDHAVHAAAARGVATPTSPLPHGATIQQLFGNHRISGIKAHTGPDAAASAAAMGAKAYATGDHVVIGDQRDLHTVAHEAAHVVQQRGGVQLKGGVGAAGDVYEQHADAVADAVVAGRSVEELLDKHVNGTATPHAVQHKEFHDDAQILENQASLKNTDVEIPALEGAILSTRVEAVKKGLLSQASFDAGLALSWAMTQLQFAVTANRASDADVQEHAARAAQQLFTSLHRETANDKNFHIVPAMGDTAAATSQNPYTEEVRISTLLSTHDTGSVLSQLPTLIRQRKWHDAFVLYRRLLDGLDLWVADQLRKTGKGTHDEARGNAQQHYAQLRTGLEQIISKHATRLPALFHPEAATVAKEKAAGRPATDTVPMNVYFWKDNQDGKLHLYDLTTPSKPREQAIDGPPTAAVMNTFFEEVARYPEGEVRYTLPSGTAGVVTTTGKTKWYEWVGYAGLAIAAVGLAFVTAGASVAATVCFAGGALAGGLSAGGHLADSVHLGTATTATVVLDVAQVAASFASFGAISITVKAGGAAAALAGSRYFVPFVSAAAAADAVQFVALTAVTVEELKKVQQGGGAPEDQQRAMAVLLTQLIVTGGLTVLSVQGARNVRALAGKPLELIEQSGTKVLRVVGEGEPTSVAHSGSEGTGSGHGPPPGSHTDVHHDASGSTTSPHPENQVLPPTSGALAREEMATPGGESVEVINRGKAVVPTGKVEAYIRGGSKPYTPEMSAELRRLQNLKQTSRKEFDQNPQNQKQIDELKKLSHNYERSRDMASTLDDAGFPNTPEGNASLFAHLLEVGQKITHGNRLDFASEVAGASGRVKLLTTWTILPDGRAYLSTVKIIPRM